MRITNFLIMKLLSESEFEDPKNFFYESLYFGGHHMDLYERGLWRGLQAFFLTNIGIMVNPEDKRPKRVTCRWIDTTGHISTLKPHIEARSDLALMAGEIEGLTVMPCDKCGAPFDDVVAIEIATQGPVFACWFRFADLVHPRLGEIIDAYRDLILHIEERGTTAEEATERFRETERKVRDFFLRQLCTPNEMSTLPEDRFHVFLSHQTGDKPFVEKIKADLEGEGYRCWYDMDQLHAGDELATELAKAVVDKCELAVFVCSKNFIRSRWASYEMLQAVTAQMNHRGGRRLVPILLNGDPQDVIPEILRPYIYIDFSTYHKYYDYNKSLKSLLNSIRKQLSALGL